MANNPKTILRIYHARRPYAFGKDDKGQYFDYFLEDVIQDVIDQDKIKKFSRLWDKKVVHPNQRNLL